MIIDETTNISVKKSLGIVVKYYCKKYKICDQNLGMIEIESGDAKTIFSAIEHLFKDLNISFEGMLGFAKCLSFYIELTKQIKKIVDFKDDF